MHQGMLLRGILSLKQVGKKEGGKQEVNGHQQKMRTWEGKSLVCELADKLAVRILF